ncbi:NAD(P)/FAD-dependent oxidoreductase [Capilliphycus salinus ALCB114379]|uniref:NAD(P)/FAD-dependent oxidoreductase n=1 Tax=Capilliphycus salinus TaxID=2768948 RepID=UPI0039A40A1F
MTINSNSNLKTSEHYTTAIVGAGFTGLFTALHLCHHHYSRPTILIDPKERFVFKPLLYEVFSGEMEMDQVLPRYEELLDCSNITYIQGSVEEIDLQRRELKLSSGLGYSYENLVLGLGSVASYFGIEGAKENSFAFRDGEDAIRLRNHLRQQLQLATQTEDETTRNQLLTVAVVGAGPSGIEIASTLADWLPQWYRELGGNPSEVRVIILDMVSEILTGDINSQLREKVKKALKKRVVPVEVQLEAKVSRVSPDSLEYQQNNELQKLLTKTVIWTAGNAVNPLMKKLQISSEERDKQSRLRVTPSLQLREFPEVFVGGDSAVLDRGLPPTAQVAYQQGISIANNIIALAENDLLEPSQIHLRGTLMKLGLEAAAVNLFERFVVEGKPAHLIRQGTYLELLPTPVHNFKATVDWITDEIFNDHAPPSPSKQKVSG